MPLFNSTAALNRGTRRHARPLRPALDPNEPPEEYTPPEHRCRACGSDGVALGALGSKLWFRCRACWWEWYIEGERD